MNKPEARVIVGDCRTILPTLEAGSVQCCVTSPPYWGLRDYGHADQIGHEPTPDLYVAQMVAVFREVKRVLRDDGTLWLNLGDSYSGSGRGAWNVDDAVKVAAGIKETYRPNFRPGAGRADGEVDERSQRNRNGNSCPPGLKPKDLIGIPWRVAFALQTDGWYLRSDIIWHKPNPMPESVTDRPTRSHEYIFLLSKAPRYYYDHEAIKDPCVFPDDLRRPYAPGQVDKRGNGHDRGGGTQRKTNKQRGHSRRHDGFNDRWDQMERDEQCAGMRNKRDVWTVAPANYKDAHFATFPPELIKPCILAGCPAGGTVLDPFGGSGTTGKVALEQSRSAVLIELNADYLKLINQRLSVTPGLPL